MEHADAVVIGAGFGGLGAALALAEAGRRVVVCETVTYPGGCAGTFERQGARFDAGATMAFGLGPGEAFRQILDRYGLSVRVRPLDPAIEVRTPTHRWPIRRSGLRATLSALPDVDPRAVAGFCDELEATAAGLRPLLTDPTLLPPWNAHTLVRHLKRLPAYLPLARQVGRPLRTVLRRHGLAHHRHVRAILEPLCRITVQAGVDEAEAPFALAALDAVSRGGFHVVGGMGALADAMVQAVRSAGGQVRFAERVRRVERHGTGWLVHTRRGTLAAPGVFANLLPQGLMALSDVRTPRLERLASRVRTGWGAAMLYLQVDAPELPPEPFHLDLTSDPAAPYLSGNHVFCSVGEAADAPRARRLRPVVASTHLPPGQMHDPAAVQAAQQRMAATLQHLAPRLWKGVERRWTASPRTFARFTGRQGGWVGGIPRRASLAQYLELFPSAMDRGLYLVGDSTLLGQSSLAATLSGQRIATQALIDKSINKEITEQSSLDPIVQRDVGHTS
ncbi:MAG: NAD(P)/FAD-dependent oxidoreductase [Myxococcales bacterium]|nr:NAD(P)/FAD-dependent oxidoreductase [Myxococcales bacterium]